MNFKTCIEIEASSPAGATFKVSERRQKEPAEGASWKPEKETEGTGASWKPETKTAVQKAKETVTRRRRRRQKNCSLRKAKKRKNNFFLNAASSSAPAAFQDAAAEPEVQVTRAVPRCQWLRLQLKASQLVGPARVVPGPGRATAAGNGRQI
jgi:hypothetical protein